MWRRKRGREEIMLEYADLEKVAASASAVVMGLTKVEAGPWAVCLPGAAEGGRSRSARGSTSEKRSSEEAGSGGGEAAAELVVENFSARHFAGVVTLDDDAEREKCRLAR